MPLISRDSTDIMVTASDDFESNMWEFCRQFFDDFPVEACPIAFDSFPSTELFSHSTVPVMTSSLSSKLCEELGLSLQDAQQRLIYCYHALHCEDSNSQPPRPCRVSPKCQDIVKLLQHVTTCTDRSASCWWPECGSTFHLMEHNRMCVDTSGTSPCVLCQPLNETKNRKRSRLSVIVNKRHVPRTPSGSSAHQSPSPPMIAPAARPITAIPPNPPLVKPNTTESEFIQAPPSSNMNHCPGTSLSQTPIMFPYPSQQIPTSIHMHCSSSIGYPSFQAYPYCPSYSHPSPYFHQTDFHNTHQISTCHNEFY